ncbi:hypothetical protein SAMN05216389_106203 [Oceanobacillus limi]|uniref:CAAX prenyl protease 2/Lysostaphin resistance protein A-like domain-containing protein n=1 Tax=Oceanobacillus limi TaxID=930131 RepID=A0A1I0CF80_9BACI|nr:type II CAAX endopeptidase family protein [Oceanobacillus limi]SET18240.1 hypothetical protein SAMN05216389_106203 [Oceanobacillus limi]
MKWSLLKRSYVWIYFSMFFLLWTIRELWLVHYLNLLDPSVCAVVATLIKLLVWVIPVILLIKLIENKNTIRYLRLDQNVRKGITWACWVSFILAVYFIIYYVLILNNGIQLDLGLNGWLNTIILVGFIEEVVFRGFLLRKLMDQFRFWTANSITSILFVSIHFPIWFYNGLFGDIAIIGTIFNVFVISIILGLLYRNTNSLWSVIIIHSVYNLFLSIFT